MHSSEWGGQEDGGAQGDRLVRWRGWSGGRWYSGRRGGQVDGMLRWILRFGTCEQKVVGLNPSDHIRVWP